MEEFKKPSLPIILTKSEKSEPALKKSNEPTEKCDNIEVVKPPNAQLCPYKVPRWSKQPSNSSAYSFEVLKSGQIIEEVKDLQKKAYWTFGRLPENDIEMAHPTISRFHAILQYRPKMEQQQLEGEENEDDEQSNDDNNENKGPPEGWYIYDLGSTHGTFLNKQRLPPKVYIRIRVGHMLRLGASTRSFILQGPAEDEEPESDLTVTELKAKRQQEIEEAELEKKRLEEEAIERAKNEGCSWGMSEDAEEETDLTHNPYATTNNEELFLDDPKKTLRGYFEREGLELVYKCDEMSAGSFICRVELPLDDANGRTIVAEVVHKGKKKDCVVQCALEACRILDRHGVLRQANQEPLKRKQKSQESDSDDDEFWDRTGDVARKKQRKANANTSVTLTYEDLLKQEADLDVQIKEIENNILVYQEKQKLAKSQMATEGDDLDAFMENLQEKDTKLDKTEIRKLRLEEQRLKSDKQRVQRLIQIAKPIDLHFTTPTNEKSQTSQLQNSNIRKPQLPMIGKRNQFSKFKIVKIENITTSKETKPVKFLNSDEEEVEEENEKEDVVKLDNSIQQNELETQDNDRRSERKNIIEEKEKMDTESNETTTISRTDADTQAFQTLESKDNEADDSVEDSKSESQQTSSENSSSSNSKKRRQRVRQRGKRPEFDLDDNVDYESSDKYAKWIPPENQTGDGMTELNKKFGY